MSETPLVAGLRAMYASRGDAAVDALRPFLSADFVFVPAGTSEGTLQREYVGAQGFLDFIRAQAAWTDDTWWPRLDELVVGESWIIGVVFVDPTRASDGVAEHFEILHRWQLRGGLIVGFRSFVNDQRRYDAFHSTH